MVNRYHKSTTQTNNENEIDALLFRRTPCSYQRARCSCDLDGEVRGSYPCCSSIQLVLALRSWSFNFEFTDVLRTISHVSSRHRKFVTKSAQEQKLAQVEGLPEVQRLQKAREDAGAYLQKANKAVAKDLVDRFGSYTESHRPSNENLEYRKRKVQMARASAQDEANILSRMKRATALPFQEEAKRIHMQNDVVWEENMRLRKIGEDSFPDKYLHLKPIMDKLVAGNPTGYHSYDDSGFAELVAKAGGEGANDLYGRERRLQSEGEVSEAAFTAAVETQSPQLRALQLEQDQRTEAQRRQSRQSKQLVRETNKRAGSQQDSSKRRVRRKQASASIALKDAPGPSTQ